MKTLQLVQGSADWVAHRARHFNASDAPAMLGVSPYVTRTELLRQRATGVEREFDDATARRFADGHRFEALARPIAERIIGEDLYPCTGVEGDLSASFDGLTLLEDVAFEHKTLNAELRAIMDPGCNGNELPEHYRVQMEQQLMVSGAERVLFMASEWTDDGQLIEERHCWYYPDPQLAARIRAGWAQFAVDVANYQPAAPVAPAPVGRTADALPALFIACTGEVTASNLAAYREAAIAHFQGIKRDLQTDQDFADAAEEVKFCESIEQRIEAAKQQALGQAGSIDELFRTLDAIKDEARAVRLSHTKLIDARKEARRSELIQVGIDAVTTHYATINATLGAHALQVPLATLRADMAIAIKGMRSFASMAGAIDAAAANAKIGASQRAESIRACIAVLDLHAEHSDLFPDRVQLCATKTAEDLRNLVTARIAAHKAKEAERAAVAPAPAPVAAPAASVAPVVASVAPIGGSVSRPPAGARLKLGDLQDLLHPIEISAAGLATLGFQPVATEKSAKLYAADDFDRICDAISNHAQQAKRAASAKVAA